MKASWYIEKGSAREVLQVGNQNEIEPKDDEVKVKIYYAGISPGEISKRIYRPGATMPYPLVIPHSDGVGEIVAVGSKITKTRIGQLVAIFGAQSYRAFGVAAEYCTLPENLVVPISDKTNLKQAAQLGIPAITGYQAIEKFGNITNKTILVHGGAGAVNQWAIKFAIRKGATVIATVRNENDITKAQNLGVKKVFLTNDTAKLIAEYNLKIDGIVEVSLASNIHLDLKLLKIGGAISTYASSSGSFDLPMWPLVFNNISIHFLGSDDFPIEIKRAAMLEAIQVLDEGWQGLDIEAIYDLKDIASAHEQMEQRRSSKKYLIQIAKKESINYNQKN